MNCEHRAAKLSFNNRKLNFPSFSLPAKKTCPKKTKECVKYCYGLKGKFLMDAVINMYEDNYQASKCDCFVDYMVHEIRRTRTTVIRVHATGDYYSRNYFKKWLQIAERLPRIVFYSYTRDYDLDISSVPDNFIVYYSVDSSTVKLNETAQRFAFVETLDKKVKHLADYKDGKICNYNNCADCGYCFETSGNIYFPQKYKKYQVQLTIMS